MSEPVPEAPGTPATPPEGGGLLGELRRRGVVRAVIGYGVAAFAILQVTEPILRGLHLPEGWLTPVVVLLGLGFPLTAALSWAFDLTARGIVRTAEAAPETPGAAPTARLAGAGAIALAAALGAALAWLALRSAPPRPATDADGRVSVAVADFANETRDPDLDGLSGLLITSLEQSKKLRVVTRARMIDLTRQLGKETAPRIDEALAREVGRRAGVRALLVASVRRLGDAYTAELQALDPAEDEYLFTLRDQARTKDELLPLIDRLSERVRLGLRERAEEVREADIEVARAVTPSLEAYRHYFKGKDAFARLDYAGAVAAYGEAARLAPDFALALYEVALVGTQLVGREKHVIRDAARLGAAAPEKEAGLIRALADFHGGRFREACLLVLRLGQRFPEDSDVAYLASQILYWTGDFSGALGAAERAIRLQPDNQNAMTDLVYMRAAHHREADALAFALEAHRSHPSQATAALLGLARALGGDPEGAVREFRGTGDGVVASWLRAQALAAAGRTEEALRGLGAPTSHFAGLARATVLGYAGRLREAVEAFDWAAGRPEADEEQFRSLSALFQAAAGAAEAARRTGPTRDLFPGAEVVRHAEAGDDARLARLVETVPADSATGRLGAALLARRQGRRGAALGALRELDQAIGLSVPYYRGVVAAEEGQHAEAAEALERFSRALLFGDEALFHPWLQARARLQLARSLDALGRREEGCRHVELQLARWRRADPDLPLLAEARAVGRRLGCRAP